jgi:hypothetical protein
VARELLGQNVMVTPASSPASSPSPSVSSFHDRQMLLRFAASFLWADLEMEESEQRFLAALATELEPGWGDDADVDVVAELLVRPPAPEDVDPSTVPPALADAIRAVARRAIAADGRVDRRETELYSLLDELLPRRKRLPRRERPVTPPRTDGAES